MKIGRFISSILLAPFSILFGIPADGIVSDVQNTETDEKKQFVLGNRFLSRTFTVTDGKIMTTNIRNKRMIESFVPDAGSKEFEISVITDYGTDTINSNDLTVMTFRTEDMTDCDGKILKILYNPYELDGVEWTVQLVVELRKDDFFMHKYLEIFVPEGKRKYAKIDYIDLEHIEIPSSTAFRWSRPDMASANMSGFHVSLGQPIYLQSLFFGCEFPATDNRIIKDTAFIRYYSGKSFKELPLNEYGAFVTWKSVVGASQDDNYESVQQDFFKYVKTFSVTSDIKFQYSTLYSKSGKLDSATAQKAFMDTESHLARNGVAPLDSYIVDEGWNNYNAGFWEFNNEFPNNLDDLSDVANKLSSGLGLHFSPCGGYTKKTRNFSHRMVRDGFGNYNSETKNLCVSSEKYVNNIKEHFIPQIEKYELNCWKIDGFALSPCKSEFHGHAFGGFENMYSVTEIWEKWIDIFELLRRLGINAGKNIQINLISFVNPSPWLLRWVNNIWLQNGVDVDFLEKSKNKKKLGGSDGDALLSYRDEQYYDFTTNRAFQFPLSNVYNNDPIYALNSKLDMRDSAFRRYLYMSATRGSSVFEMCYSPKIFNASKWRITADVVAFAKKNAHILKNARFIGSSPLTNAGIYGYSSWYGNEGIVSLRNPSNKTQTFELTLDESIGVTPEVKNLCRYKIFPYSADPFDITKYRYGSFINIALAPYEALVWHFSALTLPHAQLLSAKIIEEDKIRLEFSEHVVAVKKSFYIDGYKIKSAELLADYKTIDITVTKAFSANEIIALEMNNVIDLSDSNISAVINLEYYKDGIINVIKTPSALSSGETITVSKGCKKGENALKMDGCFHKSISRASFEGSDDFCLSFLVKTTETSSSLIRQGSEYAVMINSKGNIVFSIKGNVVVSSSSVSNGEWHHISAIREKNGVLKVYIDGILDASAYDKKHRNAYIYHDSLVIGDSGFEGELDYIVLENTAHTYDEILSRAGELLKIDTHKPEKKFSKGEKAIATIFACLTTLAVITFIYIKFASDLGIWPF